MNSIVAFIETIHLLEMNAIHSSISCLNFFLCHIICFNLYLTLRYNLENVPQLPQFEVHFAIITVLRPKISTMNCSYWIWYLVRISTKIDHFSFLRFGCSFRSAIHFQGLEYLIFGFLIFDIWIFGFFVLNMVFGVNLA